MMARLSDQNRKRGRLPGASKPTRHASSREVVGDNEEHDVEEEARPQKRGRKAKKDTTSAQSPMERQDGSAQSRTRGRPPKNREQNVAEEPDPVVEQGGQAGRKPLDDSKITARSVKSKTKAFDSPASGEPPSSETRRSGRERRPWNPDVVFGTRQMGSSPQSRTPPSDPKSRPSKRTEAVQESPGATPRRNARERRTWDPDRVFGSRLSDEYQDDSTALAEIEKSSRQVNAAQDATAVSRARKQKPTLDETARSKRRRGRPSLDNNTSPGEGSSGPRKRKQKTTQAAEPSTADKSRETAQPRRRGRPRASDAAPVAGPSQTSGPRARRGNKSPRREIEQEQRAAPVKLKRKAPELRQPEAEVNEEAGSESEEEQDLPFRHLRETIRNVPRSTISAKWSSLDVPSANAVTAFIVDAQRPVLLRLQDSNRRREHASSALAHMSRRLHTRLTRGMPFPAPTAGVSTRANAGSYEDEFDFERTVDAVQAMENTLNPLLHSVSLLQKEIQKEEDALARDYDHLHRLETNARSKAQEWKARARREHALAPGVKKKGEGDDQESGDRLELISAAEDAVLGGLFKDLEDEELVGLSKQIGSHMESMKGNLQQIGGVVPAIITSKAALQQVLLKHLDDEKYESVLLG